MGKQTLFGDSDTLKRPPNWVVRKLVRHGLDAAEAGEMDAKTAYATLERIEEYREANRQPPLPKDPPCRGASIPERLIAADDLEQAITLGLSGDLLLSFVEGSLYLLSSAELVRVARGLSMILGGGGQVRLVPDRIWCCHGSGI